jgi:hypothetical protein
MESENEFNLGRASEITRDELKFNKLIQRLRNRFSILFDELLEIQLALKGVATRAEWQEMKEYIYYDFMEDNHFSELKQSEVMTERLRILQEVDPFVGKYFSTDWIRKNVLHMSDQDVQQIEKEIDAESKEGDELEGDDQEAPEQQPTANTAPPEPAEEFEPPKELSDEEKKLVESMTRFMDSMVDTDKV